jgi:hypothetical protein
MRRVIAAATLFALATGAAPADAKCAMQHQKPVVLTKEVAVPADGGGIVVGTASVPYDDPDLGEALQKSWGFVTGRDLMQPVVKVLAPGLVVYGVQPKGRTTGELTDGKATIAKLTVTKDKVAKLAAPTVKEIRQDTIMDRRWSPTTTVSLASPVPADAIAIVLFDARSKARSWHAVTAGANDAIAYERRRCQTVPNGTVESEIGDKVSVAWVDRYGRMSPPSKLATIKGDK